MGTTANSTYVFVGESMLTAEVVLAKLNSPAIVSNPLDGWIVAFPSDESEGAPGATAALSESLGGATVVGFMVVDSDVAVAELSIGGSEAGTAIAVNSEMALEIGIPVEGEPAWAGDFIGLWADIGLWANGVGANPEATLAALAGIDLDTPFADEVAHHFFGALGVPRWIGTAYRHLVDGGEPVPASGVIRS